MSNKRNFDVIQDSEGNLTKLWARGVPVEDSALGQLENVAKLPFIYKWIAVMPDVHFGMGATIGSVIPTLGAVIPAAVGVDIGCGMDALRTNLRVEDLGDLQRLYDRIGAAIPHGRTDNGGKNDRGAWHDMPPDVQSTWDELLKDTYDDLCGKYPQMRARNTVNHLGTLGGGNHFIEICLDTEGYVWFMLHSGSRGCGNRVGTSFIRRAQDEMNRWFIDLPDRNLAYFPQKTELFDDYLRAAQWAQDFAKWNRYLMMERVKKAVKKIAGKFEMGDLISCHHNYVAWEKHFGKNVLVTRKGAVNAAENRMGIIPGSMGDRSFIVRGLGNRDSFKSCSHGAGRAMSRGDARRQFTLADHRQDTAGVVCCKDKSILDETPKAYKNIDAVMAAQSDLVEIEHTLKQIVCIKG
jgi:tRNA-splicing ligase RtcB (3'-phosphate/5'-hydroxy nucleic acid ligase)